MARKARTKSTRSPHSFKVRKATLKDLPVLVAHRRAMWKSIGFRQKRKLDEADRTYSKWATSQIRNHALTAWIAEDKGKIIGGGCVWLQPIQPMPGYDRMLQPYLLSMYTEPSSRGRGVASAIVNEAAAWSRENKFPQLRLHAADMGRGVYSKRRFKRTWEMRLRLSGSPTRRSKSNKTGRN